MRINGDTVKRYRMATPSPTRAGRPLSRAELAVSVGVSPETIARIERNQGDCAAGTAYLIAQILNVDISALFDTETEAAI